jgi:hypothetical protein
MLFTPGLPSPAHAKGGVTFGTFQVLTGPDFLSVSGVPHRSASAEIFRS